MSTTTDPNKALKDKLSHLSSGRDLSSPVPKDPLIEKPPTPKKENMQTPRTPNTPGKIANLKKSKKSYMERMCKSYEILAKPSVSQAQARAMHAAAAGNSTIDIPQDVGQEYAEADEGRKVSKLPEKKKG